MPFDDFHKISTQPGITPEDKGRPAQPEIPKTIGPYKIESLLERGGMSILYLGTHPETKEPTTIKVLSPRFLSHPEIVQRFLTEAEIIAMADHPNIVKLYGHGEWEGGLYIAMEFIEGISLRQYLLQSPMSLKRALEIIIDIAYALCHLHTHGVIHRDLKPENILVNEAGQIKVIDFGIAQLLTEKSSTGVVSQQRLIGTPIYMSPEQRENPETVSYPSDIYSLGIIAYELILGKLSHGQIHLALMPKGIQKILNKTLQPKPEDRYHDIVDFITDVSAYLNSTTMLKEKKSGDLLSELSENLMHAQKILAPANFPDWPDLELGLALHRGLNLYGIYYDFFPVPNGSYGIILGESSAKGAEGLLLAAGLRGMTRALSRLTTKPVELVSMLNEVVIKDFVNQVFTLSYLVLNPKENNLTYISCGYGNLLKVPAGTEFPTKITTQNLALGIESSTEFNETNASWYPGDCLVFNTFAISTESTQEGEFSEDMFQHTLIENCNFPPQRIVDSIFRKVKLSSPKLFQEHPLTIISILRKH